MWDVGLSMEYVKKKKIENFLRRGLSVFACKKVIKKRGRQQRFCPRKTLSLRDKIRAYHLWRFSSINDALIYYILNTTYSYL